MTKTELRALYSGKRKRLSKEEVNLFSQQIFSHFKDSFPLSDGQKVHVFLSISKFNEVDTQAFIKDCWTRGVAVYVAKMIGENIIVVQYAEDTPMLQNSWGILEPASNQDAVQKDFKYVIVPLLYADHQGNRVGYGKGFYDRFLSELNPEVLKIGVGFFSPEEAIGDVTLCDVPLDYLITPAEVLSFKGL